MANTNNKTFFVFQPLYEDLYPELRKKRKLRYEAPQRGESSLVKQNRAVEEDGEEGGVPDPVLEAGQEEIGLDTFDNLQNHKLSLEDDLHYIQYLSDEGGAMDDDK